MGKRGERDGEGGGNIDPMVFYKSQPYALTGGRCADKTKHY